MKLNTKRFIDYLLGRLLCACASFFAKLWRKPNPQLPDVPKNILVILLSEMGSIVLAGPMFAELKRRYPLAKIHILQLKKNQQVARLLNLTEPTAMHSLRDDKMLTLIWDILRTVFKLRRLKIDAVIDCELFSRISALLAYASKATIISGFVPLTQEGLYRGSFITHGIPYNPHRHISQQFLSLVDALKKTVNCQPKHKTYQFFSLPKHNELSVDITAEERSIFQSQLITYFPQLENKTLVLLYVGGGILPERAWPIKNYSELAKALIANGYAVAIIGLKEDRPLAQYVTKHCRSLLCCDLTGYTRNLRELFTLMHLAGLLVTNDGGPGHFATLTPIQTIIFFGPETSKLYAPLGNRHTVLESLVPCSPCLTAYNHRRTYCDGDNICLKAIRVETVVDIALNILSEATNVAMESIH